MIFFDVTKSSAIRHRSGLARMGERLREELGAEAQSGSWTDIRDRAAPNDWFVTAELFSEEERPGFAAFISSGRCRMAAIFADAIPLKLPKITWPKSVARHPGYMKLLSGFERVWAISRTSRDELLGYWRWLGIQRMPDVQVLPLGADLSRVPRSGCRLSAAQQGLLCVGILEPRKNQLFLLEVAEVLWRSGLIFDLHIVGRVNPHFGPPTVARIRSLAKKYPGLKYHEAAGDKVLAELYSRVRATVFPTLAEGCGLPLLESLWHGVPCVCSDLPVLQENAKGGGCLTPALNDRSQWSETLRRILTDDAVHSQLSEAAASRHLPTWTAAAQRLGEGLGHATVSS